MISKALITSALLFTRFSSSSLMAGLLLCSRVHAAKTKVKGKSWYRMLDSFECVVSNFTFIEEELDSVMDYVECVVPPAGAAAWPFLRYVHPF